MSSSDTRQQLEFPSESNQSTDETFTWDEVKEIMDKQIMRRAEYVTSVIVAMREHFGEEALDIAAEAIYQIGFRKGVARSDLVLAQGEENDLESLSELIGHKMSRIYLGTTTEISENELTVQETYCPLPVYWKSIGMANDDIVRFCKIFDQVDKGMIEGYNSDFTTDLSGAEELAIQGYCQMVVRQKQVE
ncbi:MAG: L-2-amino-thiazoline-4-carboxylic acid hydrolase [Anaerolineales bacterium]